MTTNKSVLDWVEQVKELVKPESVLWIDGSEEQLEQLRKEAVSTGEMIKLNQEKLPGCYLHRTAVNDVARVEDRTFICTRKEEDAGPTNHWMDPQKCYQMLFDIARDSYKGRTMYIIPYSMGPIGSPFSKIGVEITDSIYVVLNMSIMTRVSEKVWETLGDSTDWVKGLHAKCKRRPRKALYLPVPGGQHDYLGQLRLRRQRAPGQEVLCAAHSRRTRASRKAWMAEHMLILGVQNPKGELHYVAAAFPSACGKTNLAMLIPPEGYQKKGYKIFTVGDDIAWMRIGPDGRLWAINPENGFFGVAPGTNDHSKPERARNDAPRHDLFTNVALNNDDMTVWWEGLDKNPAGERHGLEGQPLERQDEHGKGRASEQPLHGAGKELPVHQPRIRQGHGCADRRDHLRRPPRTDDAARVSVA